MPLPRIAYVILRYRNLRHEASTKSTDSGKNFSTKVLSWLLPPVYTDLSIRMSKLEFTTHSAEETIALGRKLAAMLAPPKWVLLRGELGAGKTTLVKGIAEGFHAATADSVTSPTFTLVHEYRGPEVNVYHIDLYRVDTPRQLETLGLDDLIAENSVLLIEWGEKFPRLQRDQNAEITLEWVRNERTGDDRRIQLSTH
jgi:tRNA threonylcarbamoyladenosine biosynthesis protein TsaE